MKIKLFPNALIYIYIYMERESESIDSTSLDASVYKRKNLDVFSLSLPMLSLSRPFKIIQLS